MAGRFTLAQMMEEDAAVQPAAPFIAADARARRSEGFMRALNRVMAQHQDNDVIRGAILRMAELNEGGYARTDYDSDPKKRRTTTDQAYDVFINDYMDRNPMIGWNQFVLLYPREHPGVTHNDMVRIYLAGTELRKTQILEAWNAANPGPVAVAAPAHVNPDVDFGRMRPRLKRRSSKSRRM